jgi:hypothetical protein
MKILENLIRHWSRIIFRSFKLTSLLNQVPCKINFSEFHFIEAVVKDLFVVILTPPQPSP